MREFLLIAQQVVAGLCDLHEAGVVHKDVNPSNIVYDAESGRTVLLDLGISTDFADEQAEGTRLDGIEGTPRRLFPEQTGRVNAGARPSRGLLLAGRHAVRDAGGAPPVRVGGCRRDRCSRTSPRRLREAPFPSCRTCRRRWPPSSTSCCPRWRRTAMRGGEGPLHDLERCAAGEPFALGERDFGRRFEFAHEPYGREGEAAQLAHDWSTRRRPGARAIAAAAAATRASGRPRLWARCRRRR